MRKIVITTAISLGFSFFGLTAFAQSGDGIPSPD